MKAAFIGLGAMGYPIAGHLARRPFDLHVWNRTAEVAERHAREHGSTRVGKLEALVGAEAVLSCLPTSAEVDDVVARLAVHLRPGTVWVDLTSGDPAQTREIARRLRIRGVELLDAPVSGGRSGAEKGLLTVMVGGDESTLARVRPLLESFAARIIHVGPSGSGNAVKAVNNLLLAVHILAASEGLYALTQTGVPLDVALAAINASSGRSHVTEKLIGPPLESGGFPVTFKLGLLTKDVRIGAHLVQENAAETSPVTSLAVEVVRNAKAALGADVDYLELVKMVRGERRS